MDNQSYMIDTDYGPTLRVATFLGISEFFAGDNGLYTQITGAVQNTSGSPINNATVFPWEAWDEIVQFVQRNRPKQESSAEENAPA